MPATKPKKKSPARAVHTPVAKPGKKASAARKAPKTPGKTAPKTAARGSSPGKKQPTGAGKVRKTATPKPGKATVKKPSSRVSSHSGGGVKRGKAAHEPAGPKDDLSPKRVKALLDRLRKAYPHAECALWHRTPWELLVATILSAQCTDARVNMVTPKLFEDFPSPQAFAQATPAAIEEYVKSTGFYRNKAKSIHGAAKRVVEVYGGKLPETMDDMLTLPGAARKTANVVMGVAFKKAEGVVVDTHVLRISQRLGLTQSSDAKKVEQDLMRILPRDRWIQFSHEVILHGRQVCVARKPKCDACKLEKLCHSGDKTWSSEAGRSKR